MDDLIANRFFDIARKAIKAHEEVYEFWNIYSKESVVESQGKSAEDVIPLLKEMIIKRIEIANCFELLVRLDFNEALDVLESRYLGDTVCLYTKFGGIQNELALMLSDYLEIRGEDSFMEEIIKKYLLSEKMNDPKVISAFCEALDIDETNEFKKILNQLRSK